MRSVCLLYRLYVALGILAFAKAFLVGLRSYPAPHHDERKTSAAAARRGAEDGTALAASPRVVIRGEYIVPPWIALPQVRDAA